MNAALNSKLKLEIALSGKRQYEIARMAGMNETELSRIIRGHRAPTAAERQRLAAILSVAEPELFGGPFEPAGSPLSLARDRTG